MPPPRILSSSFRPSSSARRRCAVQQMQQLLRDNLRLVRQPKCNYSATKMAGRRTATHHHVVVRCLQSGVLRKMSGCRNTNIVTYSKKALQRAADAQIEPMIPVCSAPWNEPCSSAVELNTTTRPKTGTLHAYMQKLPPSVGVKRKPVSVL